MALAKLCVCDMVVPAQLSWCAVQDRYASTVRPASVPSPVGSPGLACNRKRAGRSVAGLGGSHRNHARGTRRDGWMSVVHPDDVERVRMAWRTAVLHGSAYNTEYRVRHADGIYRWINSRGIPILNSDGAVIYWVGVVFAIPGALRISARPQAQATRADPKGFTDIAPAAIRAARGALNMSAAELAKEAGMSISTVRRLEEDTRNSRISARPAWIASWRPWRAASCALSAKAAS